MSRPGNVILERALKQLMESTPGEVEGCWGERVLKESLASLLFPPLTLLPYINRTQYRSCTLFCRHERKRKKMYSFCSRDICNVTQKFRSPILYASLLTSFTSSSSSSNRESRDKTRHRDNEILCCGLWLHFPFKPQYFTLWITMFFVGKILNLKMLQMAFYQELWTVKINRSNYKPLLWNEPC